ncbi:thap domain-containing protein 9 [Holotrichia oblita]|uniref:Thap domain-containing protein 9 n=1 Tax=Holotrichia oblita TaxID=644536 RepID=A0ACB9SLJ6_HOLOL|nr:thap domain-containing protein 9 [Holotrichia oblita]
MSQEFPRSKLNEESMRFFLSQLQLQCKKGKGRRFSTEDKIFALSLLKQSPRGYKLLQKVFALPTRRVLLKLLQMVIFKCGINKNIMTCLMKAANKMKQLDKYGVLVFDEMALTPSLTYKAREDVIEGFDTAGLQTRNKFASHVMVFMARGIRRKWKQPVAYYFTDTTMAAADIMRNVKAIVTELHNIKLKVVATICDQSTVNSQAIKLLVDETKRNYIQAEKEYRLCGFGVEGTEVVPLFDPPHLLKGIISSMHKLVLLGSKLNS